jgi:hypothetical protein
MARQSEDWEELRNASPGRSVFRFEWWLTRLHISSFRTGSVRSRGKDAEPCRPWLLDSRFPAGMTVGARPRRRWFRLQPA